MQIIHNYGDKLSIRIDQEYGSVGNNALIVRDSELKRVVSLDGCLVAAGVIRGGEDLGFSVLDYDGRVCIQTPEQSQPLRSALEAARSSVDKEPGAAASQVSDEWRAFLAANWLGPDDHLYQKLEAFLDGRSVDDVVGGLLAWLGDASSKSVERPRTLRVRYFGLGGGLRDSRSFALLVVGQQLKLPSGMLDSAETGGYGSVRKYRSIALALSSH